jgi:hypothetical protein
VLFHVAVLVWFRSDLAIPPSPFSAAGPRAGDAKAAAGGGTEIVALRVSQPQVEPTQPVIQAVPVPEPVPEIEVVETKPKVVAVTNPINVQAVTGLGQGRGSAAGTGIEGGTGRGDGGNAEEGLFRVVPPSPRGLILPPSDRPGKLRGREVDVWVFVNARGQVVADSTRVNPPTGDGKFDEKLRKQAAEWVFDPARRSGKAIAEWFRYTIVL